MYLLKIGAEKSVLVLAFCKIVVKSCMLHLWFMIIWAQVVETEKVKKHAQVVFSI